MSDSPTSDQDSNGKEMVRPSLSLRQRHDQLLDDLKDARYASRSEAARAGIELLSESVMESGEINVDHLNDQVISLISQIEELTDQIDEIHQELVGDSNKDGPPQQESGQQSDQVNSAVSITNSQHTEKLANEVYALLSERGVMSISKLAKETSCDNIEVHEAVSRLIDSEFIARTEHKNPTKYQVQVAEKNKDQ